MNADAKPLPIPKRAIISIFPVTDSGNNDATLFVRSLLRHNMVGHLFPNLKTLSERKDTISDDATILLIDPRNTLLLRDPTALFVFYEKIISGKNHPCLYSATPKYDPSLLFGGEANELLMPNLCIFTGAMLKDLVGILEERYGDKLYERRALLEMDLQDYVKLRNVEVIMDNQRRFLVYPKYRLDVGSQLSFEDSRVTYLHTNGVMYAPYILTRCENGELRAIAKRLGYSVDDTKPDVIADNLERWYHGIKSYFV